MWITGHVVDSSGQPLSDVRIEAMGPFPGGKRSVLTNACGLYALQGLTPAAYTITFELPGFDTLQRTTDALSSWVAIVNARLQRAG